MTKTTMMAAVRLENVSDHEWTKLVTLSKKIEAALHLLAISINQMNGMSS